ncbi:MAG: ferrochelatase [Candidatus Rokubacteria bacterium]|nr:ferrochelatase [Candidatus Rokubacteria bacterium]
MAPVDALLVVSFGGPEAPEDVLPFLDNVTRGRGVPRERLLAVAEHYHRFGGASPINTQTRALVSAVQAELAARGPALAVYWGNRNWHPMLSETVRTMARDGVRRALAFVTSAYAGYPSCRQYAEDIARAVAAAGEGAPVVEKLRRFSNHPGFVEPMVESAEAALAALPAAVRAEAELAFTAHSVPIGMARASEYEAELCDTARLIAERLSGRYPWRLVFQSRSGPPGVPWLEPDILDHLTRLEARGVGAVVAVPVGFVSDHMEVKYDLDTEAAERAGALGLRWVRAATVGTDPRFVAMIRELVLERTAGAPPRALGDRGPAPAHCPPTCCALVPRP